MHLLIIEDEKGIIDFLKQGLEEEGYTISTALKLRVIKAYILK